MLDAPHIHADDGPGGPHIWPPVDNGAARPPAGRGSPLVAVVLILALMGAGFLLNAGRQAERARMLNGTPATAPAGAFAKAVAAVSPAIVNITSTVDGGTAAGTGIVLTKSGTVLTNNHVIQGATNIRAQVAGTGPTYTGNVVGYDTTHDVAVVQLHNASNMNVAPVGGTVAIGDGVVALGNAGGQGGPPVASTGSVTALDRTLTAADPNGGRAETLNGMIQVDAAIEPGDSGGALVNTSGKVVGMNTAAARGFRLNGNAAFAIPINTVLTIAKQIQAGQASSTVHIGPRGILGVQVAGEQSFRFQRPANGASVYDVQAGSPAEAAGLGSGDTIVSLGNTVIESANDLTNAMDAFHPGDKVSVGWVDTSGRHHTKTISLATGPPA